MEDLKGQTNILHVGCVGMNTKLPHYKGWSHVQDHLISKSKLKKKTLKPGSVRATVYQRVYHRTINLYDINEAEPKKPPTEAQLKALEKAREAAAREVYISIRTCSICGIYEGRPITVCEFCRRYEWLESVSEEARRIFQKWMKHKEQYIILDLETTGLDPIHDEIIQLSIINLDGKTLYHSFIKPMCRRLSITFSFPETEWHHGDLCKVRYELLRLS
jgi:uncharacterized protein YprB with RNaseH-like and TPR domain